MRTGACARERALPESDCASCRRKAQTAGCEFLIRKFASRPVQVERSNQPKGRTVEWRCLVNSYDDPFRMLSPIYPHLLTVMHPDISLPLLLLNSATMHPLVRMQRDAMLQARKIQAHNDAAADTHSHHPALTPECTSSSLFLSSSTCSIHFFSLKQIVAPTPPTPAWSPEPSPHTLGGHASGSMSPYSPAAPLGTLPPDALHFTPHTYNTPTHVPSNASYDAYVRQRHDSPQPLLEPVGQDFRSGPMNDVRVFRMFSYSFLSYLSLPRVFIVQRSYFGVGTSADCIVPSNAVTEWPPYMYASPQQSLSPQQWQGTNTTNTNTKPMSRMSSSSTTGFSHHSSTASSFGFEPSTPLSLHDLIMSPPPFESNEDAFIQLIPDSSYLAPELIPHGTNHHEELTNL